MYNQTIFGSIGYAGPSATGAFQAARELGRLTRGIVITGEGSLQLTPMCFADMLKLELKPVMYVQLAHCPQAFLSTCTDSRPTQFRVEQQRVYC